ncbi:hypothetical protein BH09MYX1_BH09MYX1_28490 [soil metagenome]
MHRSALLVTLLFSVAAAAFVACSSDSVTPAADGGSDASIDVAVDRVDGSAPIGLDCTSYCTAIEGACSGANLQHLDDYTCKAMCAKLTVGSEGSTSGNTLACRVYHVGLAAQNASNADMHCGHGGPFGYGGCGAELDDFCFLYEAQCGNTFGAADCPAAAAQIPNVDGGPLGTVLGYSIDCREYHLENAYKTGDNDGGGHCSHATKDSIAAHCEK